MISIDLQKVLGTLLCSTLVTPSVGWTRAQDGRDGRDYSVYADGSLMNLEAEGTDGYDGDNGRDGRDGYGCESGENGQDGQDGGNGGDAGSVIVAYRDISNLRMISIYQGVGYGGSGGRAGRGGRGGLCEYKDDEGRVRYERRPDGYDGSSGSSGSRGTSGSISLVPGLDQLPQEQPFLQVDYASLSSGLNSFTLSRNHWENRSGAATLFSPNSRLTTNSYSLYTHHTEVQATVEWAAPRKASDIMGGVFSLAYGGSSDVSFNAGYSVWSDIEKSGNQIKIKQVVLESEVNGIVLGELTGNGTAMRLSVDDKAKVTGFLTDEMTIEYRTKNGIGQRVSRYTGPVPANALVARADGSGYDIAVGLLPIGANHLKKDVTTMIKLHLKRAALGRNATVSIERIYKIQ
jgi:hypothetical protein